MSLKILFIMDNVYKGFCLSLVCLSHDCHIDVDHDVPTAYCMSSSSDSVKLLSRTIYTTMVVSDWCITIVTHGWWVSIQSIVGIVRGRNCFFSEIQLTMSKDRDTPVATV